MGSWNKTCGLTSLPITYKTPVYVYVLEQHPLNSSSMCYSTCFYSPVLLPFYSHYNDYGAGEDSSGPFLDLILDSIKNKLVELRQGANEYHDIPVKRENWNEELFWNALHEQRLVAIGTGGKKKHLYATMIREDVVNNIFANWTNSNYKNDGYVTYTIQDLFNCIPDVIARSKDQLIKYDNMSFLLRFERLYDWEERALVTSWLMNDARYSQIINIENLFFEFVAKGDDIRAEALLREYFKTKWIDSYMGEIRKIWTPGGFEGSQANNPNAYKFLAETVLDIVRADEDVDFD